MAIKDLIGKARDFFAEKEISVFNASNAELKGAPFLSSIFFSPAFGAPRNVNTEELRAYAKSAWVQMVTNTIKKQIMTADWMIVAEDEEEGQEKYAEDIAKAKAFLKHPNRNGGGFWSIWAPFLGDILEIDAGVIYKARGPDGKLLELWSHDGSRFTIGVDEHGVVEKYYQYSFTYPANKPLEFEKQEIIYGMANPLTNTAPYGYSPLQSIQQEVEMMIQGTRWNKEFFRNNAMPSAIISMQMSEDKLARFQQEWELRMKGKPHKLAFLNSNDVNVSPITTSNRDMEWLEGQKWYFHVIFGAYGLSPQEAGFYENSNRATGESQERVSVKNAIKPYLALIAEKINREVLVDLLGHDKLRFEWVLPDHAEDKILHEQMMAKLRENVLTINEVRAMEGLDPVPWGDEPRSVPNPFSSPLVDRPRENQPPVQETPSRDDDNDDRMGKAAKPQDMPEEAEDYAGFLRQKFKKWEDAVISNVEKTLSDEVKKEVVSKTFGEFLQNLFNSVNTVGFKEGLKRVIRVHLKEGVEEAEKELDLDIGVTEDFSTKTEITAQRQLEGFVIDGKRWNGIKGVAEDVRVEIMESVNANLGGRAGLEKIKSDIHEIMVRQIGGKVGGEVTEGRAMRIARTETNRLRNESRLDAYKQSGIRGFKEWVAVNDERTTPICRRLHGQRVPLNEAFIDPDTGKDYMSPPALPNCRSVLRFVPE